MVRILVAGLIGLVFGAGIVISGMGNPAKVLNFFDLFGTWDPSLMLVMGSALAVTFVGYRFVLKRPAPVFDKMFHLPAKKDVDKQLLIGAAVFGIGWGIAGFCPGGAIPALGSGNVQPFIFVIAMIAGIVATTVLRNRAPKAA
jgi:uncharacterized membrane protein YedE/YeeE